MLPAPFLGVKMRFTDRVIKSIKPKDKRFEVFEDGLKGFGLRVGTTGKKTWIVLYRQGDSKLRRLTLGEYPAMSLAQAHVAHSKALALIDQRIDPRDLEKAAAEVERRAPTVRLLIDEFIERGVKAKGNRTWQEYQRNLEKDVSPAWGKRKVKDIKKRDVVLLLEKVAERGARNQCNQLFKIIRRMFNFAIERDLLEYSPCNGVKLPFPEVRNDRFLNDEEIRTLWAALDRDDAPLSEPMARAMKLVLVTMQRPGEVIGAHINEFDGEWWTIPAERSKNKKEHRVYLTPLARSLFQTEAARDYLFPNPRSGFSRKKVEAMETNALARAARRLLEPVKITNETKPPILTINKFTPHDLRRTGATHLAEIGYSDEVIGAVLNHTRPGVTPIYNRYRYDKEKRQALEAWSRKLDAILANQKRPDNVITFRR